MQYDGGQPDGVMAGSGEVWPTSVLLLAETLSGHSIPAVAAQLTSFTVTINRTACT